MRPAQQSAVSMAQRKDKVVYYNGDYPAHQSADKRS